jgi:hypothetical protein
VSNLIVTEVSSGLLHLHQWRIASTNACWTKQDKDESWSAIAMVAKIVCDMVSEHLESAVCAEYRGRHGEQSPFAADLIYLCAISISDPKHATDYYIDMGVFTEFLRQQSQKWKIAGMQSIWTRIIGLC